MSETVTDPFDAPAPGGVFPAVAQLKDRLLIIWPKKVETVPDRFKPGKDKDRLTADLVFLDGETLTEKIDKEGESTPLPEPIKPGDIMRDFYLSQTKLVSQTRTRIGGMVMGRLILLPKIQGSTNNRAYALNDNRALRLAGDKQAQADFETAKTFVANLDPFGAS
jgi:hypothetical protein